MGKVGGCSSSRLPGAEGGVSRALWWEEVSSSGSTVWQAWSFRWKRWPQYRNLWDTVNTFEKAERSANVTAHCREKAPRTLQKYKVFRTPCHKNITLRKSQILCLTILYLVEGSINMLGDHHDSRADARARVESVCQGVWTQAGRHWSRVGDTLNHSPLVRCPDTVDLGHSASVHQDVFTQRVGIACRECHWNTGREGHLVGELEEIKTMRNRHMFSAVCQTYRDLYSPIESCSEPGSTVWKPIRTP